MRKARILHTMIRVGDIQRSVRFYTHVLGMEILRELDQPEEKYRLVFLGYGSEETTAAIELTCNYGVSEYVKGNAFGHIAVGVEDCAQACEEIKHKGGVITFGPEKLQGSNEIIAFTSDPDGYQIELIQRLNV